MLTSAFTPSVTAVAGSLPLSALFGLPPAARLLLRHARRLQDPDTLVRPSIPGVALLIAALGFRMPFGLALSATQGAAFGLLVICFIVVAAVWLYNLSEAGARR